MRKHTNSSRLASVAPFYSLLFVLCSVAARRYGTQNSAAKLQRYVWCSTTLGLFAPVAGRFCKSVCRRWRAWEASADLSIFGLQIAHCRLRITLTQSTIYNLQFLSPTSRQGTSTSSTANRLVRSPCASWCWFCSFHLPCASIVLFVGRSIA